MQGRLLQKHESEDKILLKMFILKRDRHASKQFTRFVISNFLFFRKTSKEFFFFFFQIKQPQHMQSIF